MKYHHNTKIRPGDRFGRLTVVAETEERYHGTIVWVCKCECGNENKVPSARLSRGHTRSCGCMLDEHLSSVREKLVVDGTNLGHIASKKISKNNTSGHRGVTYNVATGKWRAYIGFKGKIITLGGFDRIEDAVKARLGAEEQYFKPTLEKYSELARVENGKT